MIKCQDNINKAAKRRWAKDFCQRAEHINMPFGLSQPNLVGYMKDKKSKKDWTEGRCGPDTSTWQRGRKMFFLLVSFEEWFSNSKEKTLRKTDKSLQGADWKWAPKMHSSFWDQMHELSSSFCIEKSIFYPDNQTRDLAQWGINVDIESSVNPIETTKKSHSECVTNAMKGKWWSYSELEGNLTKHIILNER